MESEAIEMAMRRAERPEEEQEMNKSKEGWGSLDRGTLLVVVTLITALTYQIGINPPGGFWQDDLFVKAGDPVPDNPGSTYLMNHYDHKAGDPIMGDKHPTRYLVLMVVNWIGFYNSMTLTIWLLIGVPVTSRRVKLSFLLSYTLLVLTYNVSQVGTSLTVDLMIWLGLLVFAAVSIFFAFNLLLKSKIYMEHPQTFETTAAARQVERPQEEMNQSKEGWASLDRSNLIVVVTIITTLTYQIGINPPGGFWQDDLFVKAGDPVPDNPGSTYVMNHYDHKAGDSIMRHKHPTRYGVLMVVNWIGFYNSVILTIWLLIGVPVTSRRVKLSFLLSYTLLVLTYNVSQVGNSLTVDFLVWLLYAGSVAISVFYEQNMESAAIEMARRQVERPEEEEVEEEMNKSKEGWGSLDRGTLLVVVTLITALTYQISTNPPGGFWQDDGSGSNHHLAGNPVMRDKHPKRYRVLMLVNWLGFYNSMILTLGLLVGVPVTSRRVKVSFLLSYTLLVLTYNVSQVGTSLTDDLMIWLGLLVFAAVFIFFGGL
ncbi:uncharacterized protein [Typha angustifolia]|uniref:uncharacterized protein n=1 Tax=Typha angustifolia TaxID=59011 RepID=UPI003C2E468E